VWVHHGASEGIHLKRFDGDVAGLIAAEREGQRWYVTSFFTYLGFNLIYVVSGTGLLCLWVCTPVSLVSVHRFLLRWSLGGKSGGPDDGENRFEPPCGTIE
jgi:hypothetical protein